MSLLPWEADRPLTLGMARAVVRAAFPAAAADSLEPLGSGWEFDAFVTSDGWVFRFPRRSEAEALFERERPVLDLARSVLPRSVAVPQVQVLDHGLPDFPYRVAAHRLIAGVAADRVEDSLRSVLAATIGAALSAIHSVPGTVAREAGLVELDRDEAGRIDWLTRGSAGVRELSARHAGLDAPVRWLARVEDPLRRLDAPLRMIHQDLSPEHLVADPATGRLAGILDWTDAILGDPARDFVPLVTLGGWGFADEVFEHYACGVDPGFRERLRFMARLLPLMWLGQAYSRGEEVARHVEWVEACFAEESAS